MRTLFPIKKYTARQITNKIKNNHISHFFPTVSLRDQLTVSTRLPTTAQALVPPRTPRTNKSRIRAFIQNAEAPSVQADDALKRQRAEFKIPPADITRAHQKLRRGQEMHTRERARLRARATLWDPVFFRARKILRASRSRAVQLALSTHCSLWPRCCRCCVRLLSHFVLFRAARLVILIMSFASRSKCYDLSLQLDVPFFMPQNYTRLGISHCRWI